MNDPIARLREDVRNGPRGRVSEIAAGSGVNIKTLRNLIYGAIKTTGYENALALQAYYETEDRGKNGATHESVQA